MFAWTKEGYIVRAKGAGISLELCDWTVRARWTGV